MPTPSTAPAFGDADIPALMADMGIAVTVGGVAGIGLLDEADEIMVQDQMRGGVIMTATALTIQTSQFPNAAVNSTVVIGARQFTVRERLRVADGGLTKLLLGNDTHGSIDGGFFDGTGGIGSPVGGGIFDGTGGIGSSADGEHF